MSEDTTNDGKLPLASALGAPPSMSPYLEGHSPVQIEPDETTLLRPHRRSVLKAAAWTAPAVAVAAAAPAYAASGADPVVDPTNGVSTGGNLQRQQGTVLTGFVDASYTPTQQSGTVTFPVLTAVVTASGNWAPDVVPFRINSVIPTVGQTVVRDGLAWTVTSVSATSVTLSTPETTLPGETDLLRVPRVFVEGTVASAVVPVAPAFLSISLSGIPGAGASSTQSTGT